jgi:hypothetical protein
MSVDKMEKNVCGLADKTSIQSDAEYKFTLRRTLRLSLSILYHDIFRQNTTSMDTFDHFQNNTMKFRANKVFQMNIQDRLISQSNNGANKQGRGPKKVRQKQFFAIRNKR